MLSKLVVAGLLHSAASQQASTQVPEQGPSVIVQECKKGQQRCSASLYTATIDANWRWVHVVGGYTNCYTGSNWDTNYCPDPVTCATKCALEGADADKYANTYGVSSSGPDGGVRLRFVTYTQYGNNYGSRLYLRESDDSYKMFYLKNREFAFDVMVTELPCGLNAALYFVEMPKNGGKGVGNNQAGARYGTGYCDAQCPHDIKWIAGEANVMNWNASSNPPVGHYGSCCAEMDIWEANRMATAFTAHPCKTTGPAQRCEGVDCGDIASGDRYHGLCDKDGCDFNSFRLGEKSFFGMGPSYSVDTTLPITVVTQFITSDGTDAGDLVEIRRFYRQNGKVIPNSHATILGPQGGDSIKDAQCTSQKQMFGEPGDFGLKGGLKSLGQALDRGMVLVMSLWDDAYADMLWLDSSYPADKSASSPGVTRGPCPTGDTNTPEYVRENYPDAAVKFSNFAVGDIGTTVSVQPPQLVV